MAGIFRLFVILLTGYLIVRFIRNHVQRFFRKLDEINKRQKMEVFQHSNQNRETRKKTHSIDEEYIEFNEINDEK